MLLMKRLLPFLLLLITQQLFSQIFVNKYSIGNNDGTSWDDAYTSLHVAIANANAGDEIWVAKGFYTPSEANRNVAYEITKPLKIYGGFEDQISKEEKEDGRTYISGSIGNATDTLDNSFHIFKIADFEGTVVIDGIEFNDAYADGPNEEDKVGGAIYCQSTNLQLNNCWFLRNRAEESAASIFYNPSIAGELNITNSYFEGNFSKNYDGIYVKTPGSKLKIESTDFTEQTRAQTIIQVDSSDVDVKNSSFYNNENKSSGCISLKGDGSNKLYLLKNKFYENTGSASALVYAFNTSVVIDSCSFHNNYIGNAGSIFANGGDSLVIKNSIFENNSSKTGYGLHTDARICEMLNVKYINNYSESGFASGSFYGGKIRIENCLLENVLTGGPYAGFYISIKEDVLLRNTTFYNLTADQYACLFFNGGKNITIDSCQFLNNKTQEEAAAFYASLGDDTLNVRNCVFDGNESTTNSKNQAGCYYVFGGVHVLKNSYFNNNKSSSRAGTFFNSGSKLFVDSCQFYNNYAKNEGGAVYSVGEYSEIKNSKFIRNRSGNGGALYLSNYSTLVHHCIFKDNGGPTNINGGAINYSLNKDSSFFYGNIFKGNVSENGGAIYLNRYSDWNGKSYIINNTIVDNKSINGSGALYFKNGSGVLKNNIIWKNGDFSIYLENEAQVDYEQNIVNGIEANSNNMEEDPFLSDNYAPLAFSNAVDFGVVDDLNSVFPRDVYGNQRIQGNGVDIGAVETEYTTGLFTLKGRVVNDPEETCQGDDNVKGLKGILIKAMPGDYYTTTNADGEFSFRLPVGEYSIMQSLTEEQKEEMLPVCPETGIKTDLKGQTGNQIVDAGLFFNNLKECDRLDIRISSLRKRNCYGSKTEVLVTNKGAFPVTNQILKINLSDNITPNNFVPMYQNISVDTLNFLISELKSLESYKLEISDSVNCDPTAGNLGDYVCTKAIINTVDKCTKPWPDWDLSNVTAFGECNGDGAVLYLANPSFSAMSSEQEYRVFLDDTIVFKGRYQLKEKDTMKVMVYDDGFENIRIEADQTEGNMFNALVSYKIGACALNNNGVYMPSTYHLDNGYGKAEQCTQITGSYDPNEVVVSPTGWGDEGNILKDQLLTYTIYFQNTGTDTALNVRIVDTLSQYYDMSTFKELPSSHEAELHLFGNNPTIAVWTLKNINLPDSTTDLVGSQGYVSFSVDLSEKILEGTKVENTANIYFDYNNPITTNTALNTIRSNYPERLGEVTVVEEVVTSLETDLQNSVMVCPNPFTSQINIKGLNDYNDVNLRLISTKGEIIYQGKAAEINSISVEQTGVFIYEIYNRNEILKRGKLIKLQ